MGLAAVGLFTAVGVLLSGSVVSGDAFPRRVFVGEGVGGFSSSVDSSTSSPSSRMCTPGRVTSVGRKGVALTFDDGPSGQTRRLLAALHRFNVPATFFVVGVQVYQYPRVVAETVAEGHTVGNHTVHHSYDPTRIAGEMRSMNRLIRRVAGVNPTYFRAPGLTRSPVVDRAVRRERLCNVTTDYDVGDWRSPRIPAAVACSRVVRNAHRGSVVLLHDGPDHWQTVKAVPCIIRGLHRRGFRIVSLEESVGVPSRGKAGAGL